METLLPIRRRASQHPRRANRAPRGTRPSCTLTARPCAARQKAATTPLTNHKKNPQPRFNRNQQYSITAVSDGGGTVVERYAYSAYGQVTIADASGSEISDSAIANRYTYTGREWDEGLSLFHFRARMYDPASGRFCGRDPLKSIRNLIALYAGQFASKSALDPGGDDWVFPWNPNAQWWWPFSSVNPYEPARHVDPPAPRRPLPHWVKNVLRGAAHLLLPCLATAGVFVGIDVIIDIINGEPVDLLDKGTIASALFGCMNGLCVSLGVLVAGPTTPLGGVCTGIACALFNQILCAAASANNPTIRVVGCLSQVF